MALYLTRQMSSGNPSSAFTHTHTHTRPAGRRPVVEERVRSTLRIPDRSCLSGGAGPADLRPDVVCICIVLFHALIAYRWARFEEGQKGPVGDVENFKFRVSTSVQLFLLSASAALQIRLGGNSFHIMTSKTWHRGKVNISP